jgi:hypothetical protein
MSKILVGGKTLPCCAAPPVPDPAEPACYNPADSRNGTLIIGGIAFAFCSPRCKARFLSHEDWGPAIARDVAGKL